MSGVIKEIDGVQMRHVGNARVADWIDSLSGGGVSTLFPNRGINALIQIKGPFAQAAAVTKAEQVKHAVENIGISPQNADQFYVEPREDDIGLFVPLAGPK